MVGIWVGVMVMVMVGFEVVAGVIVSGIGLEFGFGIRVRVN